MKKFGNHCYCISHVFRLSGLSKTNFKLCWEINLVYKIYKSTCGWATKFSILFGSNALKGVIESIIFSNSKIHSHRWAKQKRKAKKNCFCFEEKQISFALLFAFTSKQKQILLKMLFAFKVKSIIFQATFKIVQ